MLQTDFEAKTHATFERLMWAFSYPGRVQELKLKPSETGFMAIAEALLDLENSAWTNKLELEQKIRATGAKIKSLEQAQYVFCTEFPTLDLLRVIRRGTPLEPETSATLILAAKLETGQNVRLSGAGIQGSLEAQIDVPLEFWAMRDEVLAYPIGWDVLIVDGNKVLGLPRTTRIEVK
ncbi:MAG: phosphonate lyase system protein PhnH [Deinococcota bacterium]|jgi:alpha-D-ribose 1-methylphosphonate 5-triphosphate synthase subunit PhnH